MGKVAAIGRDGRFMVNPSNHSESTTHYSKSYISEGAAVTDGLALYLDANDWASYPGTKTMFGDWDDYGSNQAHYRTMGSDGVVLLGTSVSWIGRFIATTTATGNHTLVFDYWSDSSSSSLVLNNDGIMDNEWSETLTAETYRKTYVETVNCTSTGEIRMYLRNNTSGKNVYIDNVRFFENGTTWYDLSGNGYNATVGSSVEFQADKGVSLKTLNSELNSNQKIESSSFGTVTWANFTFELWFTDNGSQGGDPSAFGFDNGSVSSYGARYNGTVQTWINSTLDFSGTAADTGSTICQLVMTGDGQTFKFYINGSLTDTETADETNAGPAMTRYHLNSDSRTSSNNGYNGNYAICRMYSKTLSAAEIKQNFNSERNRFGL